MYTACRSLALIVLFASIITACGKGGGNTPPPPPDEANLAISTDPANASVVPPALSPYTLKVTVNSVMPSNGVKIDITARKDDGTGGTAFFTSSTTSSNSVNNFTITGTPANTQCIVQVTVTSRTKASNTAASSYRYSSK